MEWHIVKLTNQFDIRADGIIYLGENCLIRSKTAIVGKSLRLNWIVSEKEF